MSQREAHHRVFDSFNIEMKETPTGVQWAVYGFGTYGKGSVLEGQTKKVFLEYFDEEFAAKIAYPGADVGFRSANNTYSHLPDEEDPVPGGMYPDDIDDGI